MLAVWERVWRSPWALLAGANFLWAVNIVIARGIVGEVPPIALAYWRWTGAFFVAVGFAWPHLRRDWPVLLRSWRMMLFLSATGVASYNALSYIGIVDTTALNVLLLQSASPLIILAWGFLLFGDRPTWRQGAGILVSLGGVAVIAAHGSLAALAGLTVNRGDVWVLAALAIYAVYCVVVKRRPSVHPLSFLVAAMAIGSVQILPFMVWEYAQGARITGGAGAYWAIAYTAVLPSCVAYLMFNRGLELAGPGPAGQSMHLMPLFGTVLAVLVLKESFEPFHAAGIGLIGLGIVLASLRRGAIG
jgi:hypothetical protein